MKRCLLIAIVSVLINTPVIFAANQQDPILERIGVKRGICVLLGDPTGELAVELARESELMIYVQLPQAENVERVRRAADDAGFYGTRIFVDKGLLNRLHLADNIADAIVAVGGAKGVPNAEVLRVLRPQAKAFLGRKILTKPYPKGVDDWSYPYHSSDNNPQSADLVARAPYLSQYIAEPKFCPSPAVTVAAGGRIFRAYGHLAHQANQNAMLNTLLAVNAYNGTILWKRPLREGFMILRNTIIATPETLYLADDKSCRLLNAATGELRDELIVSEDDTGGTVWKWMALGNDVLYALIGGEEVKAPPLRSDSLGLGGWPRANWPGFDYPDPKTAWGQGRTLLAIDLKTKKVLWRHREQEPVDGRAVCMRNGRIYYLGPEKLLACLNAETGRIVWKTSDAVLLKAVGPLFPQQPRWTGLSPFPYVRCNDKFLFFSGPRIPRVVAVSTSVHLLLREDALYAVGQGTGNTSFSMEYDTGEVLTHFLGRRACTMVTGSTDSIFYRAPGGTVRIDPANWAAEHIAPMRPPCYEGVIISGGLLHWGAWKCRCQLSLYGHICLSPAGDFNYRPGLDESRLESGLGDPTRVEKFEVHPDDWPRYNGSKSRASTTKVAIPRQVSRRWTSRPSSSAMPTAPVVAGGVVFVGDHNGLLRAMDASSGKLRWKAYTGGAVFHPPAVWQGRVYLGSTDGHVYAFEAATGRLVWRFRAAPARRWIPIFSKLISTWPVAGGVVVDDGVVYAAAGIAHYDGTHVYALDAVTGEVEWYNDTSGKLSQQTSSGISLQGNLYIDEGQLRFAGGNACPLASYDLKTGECTSEPNNRFSSAFRTAFYPYYPEHGQYMSLNHTLADGRTLDYAVEYSGTRHSTLALFEPLSPGAKKLPPYWRFLPRAQEPKTKP
ncbi:MAG: outer membrane protein assembly factor BamB family protein, partial [Planctomycetota bacterium]